MPVLGQPAAAAALIDNEGYKDGGAGVEPLPVFFYLVRKRGWRVR